MEKLAGTVLGTIFRNPENGYSVLAIRVDRSEHTAVGTLPELNIGEQVILTGDWTEHKTFGRQFKVSSFELKAPSSLLGIERYLASGVIRGIGFATAHQIVSFFGEETMEVLSEHPERLMELPGIGEKRAFMIAESFAKQQGTRQAIMYLLSRGIPSSLAVKIGEHYRESTQAVMESDPYQLCVDLEGFGFRTADRIGLAIGIPRDAESRIRAAMQYVMREAGESYGHCYLPEDSLIRATADLLQIGEERCGDALTHLLLSRYLVAEMPKDSPPGAERRVYLPEMDRAEKEVALRMAELMAAARSGPRRHARQDIARFEREHRIVFSDTQRETILQALENGVFIITGGPGTGKTTIINCILSLLSQDGKETLLCAPTGRAAKRMTEATGAEAQTIHRLLEYGKEEGVFARNEDEPLEADCVIADEASMIDLWLMKSLLRAISPGTRLIIVGDADQLPSVGAGNVLGDLLDSGKVPCARLTDIFRQSQHSRIVLNAHLINRGEMPVLNEKGSDFFFQRQPGIRDAANTVVSLMRDRLPGYLGFRKGTERIQAVRNIQVLAPARKGDCGVNTLNLLLREAMNPASSRTPELSWKDMTFRLGDKVIQTRNNYNLVWRKDGPRGGEEGTGVFNGDIGFVTEVDPAEHILTVRFDDERDVIYEDDDLEDLDLAYCLSVHKSQGSEFPVVIMPVTPAPAMLLTRNLFYTALTRAKSLVVLVGTEDVIASMVRNDHVARRYTTLSLRLSQACETL